MPFALSIGSIILPPLKARIVRMAEDLSQTTIIIVVEVIGIVPFNRRGRKHQLNIVTMVLHDTVVIPCNITFVTNPLLHSREILSGIETSHSLNSFHFQLIYVNCSDISYIRGRCFFLPNGHFTLSSSVILSAISISYFFQPSCLQSVAFLSRIPLYLFIRTHVHPPPELLPAPARQA